MATLRRFEFTARPVPGTGRPAGPRLLGLSPGDAHVIRSAGGRATPEVVEAIRISRPHGHTREVLVIHHTGCVALAAAGGLDPNATVAADVWTLRGTRGLPHADQVTGAVLDRDTGDLGTVIA